MKFILIVAVSLLVLGGSPAQAQRKAKTAAASDLPPAARRLQPLFGGLTPVQAEQLVGASFLADVGRSFPSRAEASRFFSTKGYEYLTENQPDTAAYRFNLAWVLDPNNADAYRGLGLVVASRSSPSDQAIELLTKALTLAPTNPLLLSDLGTSHLLRYEQTKKKKDLQTATALLEKATTQEATNAVAWQQLGRAYYFQEKYAQAWDAVHKAQTSDLTAVDFNFISDLLARLPDPQGKFK